MQIADMYAVWLQIKLMFVHRVQSSECTVENTMAHLKNHQHKVNLLEIIRKIKLLKKKAGFL